MKKILFFMITLFMSLSVVHSVIEDDFVRANDTTLGTATNGNIWDEVEVGTGEFEIISNSLFYDLNSAPAGNSNNWAFLNNTNSNNIRIDYINYTVSTALTMSNRQQYLIGGSSNLNESNQATESSYYIITEQSGVGGMAYFSGGSWNSLNYTVSNGETINVSLRNINYTSDTFDFYVNDILRKSGAAFRNNADTFKQGILYVEIGTINSGDISIGCIVTDSSVCFSEETQITFNNPTQGQFLNDTNFILNVSFSETTNSTYILNGGSETTLGTNENESTVNLTGVEGLNNITVFTNTSGDLNNKSINFTIDTTNPIINDSIPAEISDYNFDGSWFSCSDTNLASCNISIDGFNEAAGNNFTLTHNGNLSYNITAIDLAGNAVSESGTLFVNPRIFFSFEDSGTPITDFTFGGRNDVSGYVNYTIYNDSLVLGNNTLLFEKLGFISQNFSFEFTNTTATNFTFNVSPAIITVNIFDRDTETLITDNVSIQLIGPVGNTTSTTNGTATLQAVNGIAGDYQIIASTANYETESVYFTYTNQENVTLNVFMLATNQTDLGIINVLVKDTLSFFVESAIVNLLEWKPAQSAYVSVAQCQTAANGQCSLNIELNNKLYKFQATKDTSTKTTNGQIITVTDSTITITLEDITLTAAPDLENVVTSFNETVVGNVSTTRLQWADTDGVVSQACITTYRDTGFTQQILSQNCTSSSSGILFATNNINNTFAIKIVGTVDYAGTSYIVGTFRHLSTGDISFALEDYGIDIFIPTLFLLIALGVGLFFGNIYISLFLAIILEWIAAISIVPGIISTSIAVVITVIALLAFWGLRKK